MLSTYISEILLQGKKLRTFLLFGIYSEVNYKSFLKNSFLKKHSLNTKIINNVL